MNIVYTVIATTLAIIIAEIVFNYGLGDLVKDFFLSLFKTAEGKAIAKKQRLEARLARIKAAL